MSAKSFNVPNRHEIVAYCQQAGVQTGDMIFRLSDTKGPFGIPFSSLVASMTHSKYSHVSLIFVEGGEYYCLEMSDQGTVKLRLIDWLDYCVGSEFEIVRYVDMTPTLQDKLMVEINKFLAQDPDYNFTYDLSNTNTYYCTETVAILFQRIGLNLFHPRLLKDVITCRALYWLFLAINFFVRKVTGKGFDPCVPIFYVGNEQDGMLANPALVSIVRSNPYPG